MDNMINSGFFFDEAKEERKTRIKKDIYSVRVSSVPLKKKENLQIQAAKKILSPILSKQLPQISYLYTPTNDNSSRPKKSFRLKYNHLLINNRDALPKTKWVEKHFSCYEKFHPRSKSIQDNYKKIPFRVRKISMAGSCEISLQT